MADPPLSAGGVNATTALSSPRVAVTAVGASGIEAGIIAFDGADVVVPAELVAVAINLYVSPFVNPVITQLVAGAFMKQLFSGLIGAPAELVATIL